MSVNILVDIEFIINLREKYAMMRNLSKEDQNILDYCENLLTNYHVNRGLRAAYQENDIKTYNELKTYKADRDWNNSRG